MTAADTPADQGNRLAALAPERSVCVTAPAGSGKTELLTQRVLRLLASVEQPEEILAITFTRKAAAEMHHRIVEALRQAESERPEAAHRQLSWQLARDALTADRQRGWYLLDNPGRLKIQTIDSLCASLTRQMPVLSQFGAQPRVTDQADPLYQQAIAQLFARLEQDTPVAQALGQLLTHLDNDYERLQRLLTVMLQRRDQWLLYIGSGTDLLHARDRLEHTLATIITDLLQVLRRRLADYAPELAPLLDYAGTQLAHTQPDSPIARLAGCTGLPPAAVEALPQWEGVADLLLTRSGPPAFRRRVDKNIGFPTQTADGDKALARERKTAMGAMLERMADDAPLLATLVECQALPAPHYPDRQWQLMESLLQLLPVLVAELTLVFQQEGAVDFSQVSLAALDGLGESLDPTALALRLDARLRHILIDEFQDTSSSQFRLLEKLTNGWAEYNEANPDAPNTLFLVGDGMQSIYGFREANVGLFLEARHHGVNGIALDDLPLTVNFRSAPAVVDWNNRIFQQAFPDEENLGRGAVPYEPAVAFQAPAPDSEVRAEGFVGDDAIQREAEHTVALIERVQADEPDGSIAVLVRSRNHLQPIIEALVRRGMTWNATDIDRLRDYACIQDLLSLTRALLRLDDRVSWAALLRTPWFGLNNRDLHVLVGGCADQCPWSRLRDWSGVQAQLSTFARERLSRQVPVIDRALQRRQRHDLREWVEGCWISLGGLAALRDERELDMVERYFELLEQHQSGGVVVSLGEFETALDKLYAGPPSRSSQLHLMTVHKSKGLEFDTVILPALARAPRTDEHPLLMWREFLSADGRHSGMVFSPLPETGVEDRIYRHLRFEQNQAQALETTRLLYVAATRAIKRLYLSFTTEVDSRSGEPRGPVSGSLLASAWTSLADAVVWREAAAPAQQIDMALESENQPGEAPATLWRLERGWRAPDWSFPNPLAAYYPASDFDEDTPPEPESDPLASVVGTVVHQVFQALIASGVEHWEAMASPQRERWLRALLLAQGLPGDACDAAVVEVRNAVSNTLGDSAGRWMLTGISREDATEFAVSSLVGERIQHRFVDRLRRDADGVVWIIDYKTGAPAAGESEAAFIQRQVDQYRGQLMDYRWHISQLGEAYTRLQMALYFTAIPRLQPVD